MLRWWQSSTFSSLLMQSLDIVGTVFRQNLIRAELGPVFRTEPLWAGGPPFRHLDLLPSEKLGAPSFAFFAKGGIDRSPLASICGRRRTSDTGQDPWS